MEFVVDVRERGLLDALRGRIDYVTESLAVGDFVIRRGGEDVCVIERKTLKDMGSSIVDGRYREQKERLMGSGIPMVIYLIEGDLSFGLDRKVGSLPASTLVGGILNSIFRDGLCVYKTGSMAETAEFLCLLDKKCRSGLLDMKKESFGSAEEIDSRYSVLCSKGARSKVKKENMTPRVWFLGQLNMIPQVTERISTEIVRVYPTVMSLCAAYESSESPQTLLKDLKYAVKNGERRIGEKISSRIYEFFTDACSRVD